MSGFLTSLGYAIKLLTPTRVIIVFDGKGGSQRRRSIYPDYKAGRKPIKRLNRSYEDMLDDVDPIVRMDVVRALADLADPRSRGALRARAEIDLDPRVRRRIREVVRDLGGEKQKAKHFEDEITKLEQAHAELKTRVSKLEARVAPAATTTPPTKPTKAPAKPAKTTAKRKKR